MARLGLQRFEFLFFLFETYTTLNSHPDAMAFKSVDSHLRFIIGGGGLVAEV